MMISGATEQDLVNDVLDDVMSELDTSDLTDRERLCVALSVRYAMERISVKIIAEKGKRY